MSIFFKKTVQHYQNENGVKKTSFSVVKDNHGIIHKINGVGNGDKFNIKETVAKNINGDRRKYAIQQRYYKIKASNLQKLLEHSTKKKESLEPKKSVSKKVTSKKSVKSDVKLVKSDVKSVKSDVKKVVSKKKSDKKEFNNSKMK